MDVVKTTGLTKHFKNVEAVSDLCINVPAGSLYGFLGPNGAGKTTTIKMLTGFLKPDAGKYEIMGEEVVFGDSAYMKHIGFLPDVPSYYNYMSGKEFLSMCAHFHKADGSKVPGIIEKTGLGKFAARKIGSYSRGMKQRLGIAQALVNDPAILILDEPVSALDPVGRKEILDMLASLKGSKTIFFSTHILEDVERICSHAAIINEGKLLLEGTIGDIKALGGHGRIILSLESSADILSEALSTAGWVVDFSFDGTSYVIEPTGYEEAGRGVPVLLQQTGAVLKGYEQASATLEDIFVKAVNNI
ncbi:MAG: ABC transporter ATP-binding protein [Clostridia bacterium]|nr:ABC transporter ATP-binding protein [Clostridia bacterium]